MPRDSSWSAHVARIAKKPNTLAFLKDTTFPNTDHSIIAILLFWNLLMVLGRLLFNKIQNYQNQWKGASYIINLSHSSTRPQQAAHN